MLTKTRYKEKLSSSGDYLQIPRSLVKKLGFPAAIFLGELIDHHDLLVKRGKISEDQRFYYHFKYVTENIGLSEKQQRLCIRKLKAAGLIDFGEHLKDGRHWLYEIKIDNLVEFITGTDREKLSLAYPPKREGMGVDTPPKGKVSTDDTPPKGKVSIIKPEQIKTKPEQTKPNQNLAKDEAFETPQLAALATGFEHSASGITQPDDDDFDIETAIKDLVKERHTAGEDDNVVESFESEGTQNAKQRDYAQMADEGTQEKAADPSNPSLNVISISNYKDKRDIDEYGRRKRAWDRDMDYKIAQRRKERDEANAAWLAEQTRFAELPN